MRASLLVLAATAILFVLATDARPKAEARPAPTADQVAAARDAIFLLRDQTKRSGEPGLIRLTPEHLDGLSALASHVSRPDRLDMFAFDGKLEILGSHRLPFGRWLNVTAQVEPDEFDLPVFRLTFGSIRLGPTVSRTLIDLAPSLSKLAGIDLPSVEETVNAFRFEGDQLVVSVNLVEGRGTVARILAMQSRLEPKVVADIFCRIVEDQRRDPQSELAIQVRRAFATGRGSQATTDTNRAAFVALAMLVVDQRAGALAGVDAKMIAGCPAPNATYLLHGRSDLSKHWALSAALAAGPGQRIAEVMGEWKELADSLSKQSQFAQGDPTGFSFVDISADRSGFLIAQAASSARNPAAMAAQFSRVTANDILPSALLKREEGPEFQFARSYGTLDDRRYTEAIEEIDAVLYRESMMKFAPQ